jgi:hypothetical protein
MNLLRSSSVRRFNHGPPVEIKSVPTSAPVSLAWKSKTYKAGFVLAAADLTKMLRVKLFGKAGGKILTKPKTAGAFKLVRSIDFPVQFDEGGDAASLAEIGVERHPPAYDCHPNLQGCDGGTNQ